MLMTNVVFKQELDETMIDHITTLRETRLGLAEKMLENLTVTARQIDERGLLSEPVEMEELKIELIDRIASLKEKMDHPGFIFDDEITLYSDLLADGAPRD
jgi:hypothetical protein